jgi:hypothetical protein
MPRFLADKPAWFRHGWQDCFWIADDPIVSLDQNFVTLGNGLVGGLDLDNALGP